MILLGFILRHQRIRVLCRILGRLGKVFNKIFDMMSIGGVMISSADGEFSILWTFGPGVKISLLLGTMRWGIELVV